MARKTEAERKLLEQLETIAHNAEVARLAWLARDYAKVATAVTAVEIGARNLDGDLSDAVAAAPIKQGGTS